MVRKVMNCDLALVGGGGSGLVAAVKAKDLGVKTVIVLESARKAIPNFFAAGDNAAAMDGGMGWAAVSGYMCGISAAKYLGIG